MDGELERSFIKYAPLFMTISSGIFIDYGTRWLNKAIYSRD